MLTAIFLSLLGTQPIEVVQPQAQPFIEEAAGWLLNGERLPVDYRLRLLAMEPEQRAQALVYLRRIGLLTDRPWSIEDLLRPAIPLQTPAQK